MDTSDGYEGLDFGLADPGLIEDTRIAEEAARQGIDPVEAAMAGPLREFDARRDTGAPATGCLVRVRTEGTDEVAGLVARSRMLERLQSAVRAPDLCLDVEGGEVVLALANCDIEGARKRVGLMLKLIEMDPELGGLQAGLWAGIAPVDRDSMLAMRTARLACDLAAFHAPGHIEVVDL
jgi:hypothetical protein